MSKTQKLLDLVAHKEVIRSRDLAAHGISRVFLQRLCAQGDLERIGRGLYALPNRPVTQHHALVLTAQQVPQGIIVLLSALQFHALTTQLPSEVWLGIDRHAHKPRMAYPPLRIVRYSGVNLLHGVETHQVEGVQLRVTSKAKTVADGFKYRHKLGLDVALEALRDYMHAGGSIEALAKAATVCRVGRIMRPYMESIV
jgi:predicted transcriptional regulator of viral defense system